MNKDIVYIDYDEALCVYGKMIDASEGGFEGVRDEGGIRATLDFVQNDNTKTVKFNHQAYKLMVSRVNLIYARFYFLLEFLKKTLYI